MEVERSLLHSTTVVELDGEPLLFNERDHLSNETTLNAVRYDDEDVETEERGRDSLTGSSNSMLSSTVDGPTLCPILPGRICRFCSF